MTQHMVSKSLFALISATAALTAACDSAQIDPSMVGPNESQGALTNPNLTAPEILSPRNGGDTTDSNPRIVWSNQRNAEWHNVWIDGPQGVVFNKRVEIDICNESECTLDASDLPSGTNTVWVQAEQRVDGEADGAGAWSRGVSWTVIGRDVGLIAPSGVITETRTPNFVWVSSGAIEYGLWVNDTERVGTVDISVSAADARCDGGETTCTFNPGRELAFGAAKFWVFDPSTGRWSTPMGFDIRAGAAPTQPMILDPVDGKTYSTGEFTIVWEQEPNDAIGDYRVWVKQPEGFFETRLSPEEARCSDGLFGKCSVTVNFEQKGAHKVWVQTRSSNGNSPWSVPVAFATE